MLVEIDHAIFFNPEGRRKMDRRTRGKRQQRWEDGWRRELEEKKKLTDPERIELELSLDSNVCLSVCL